MKIPQEIQDLMPERMHKDKYHNSNYYSYPNYCRDMNIYNQALEEVEAVLPQIIALAEKRGAEGERESTRPEKFNIPPIIKRGATESRFKITREESIYGYDLWRGHYIELGHSSGGFRDIQDTLRSCEEVAERLLAEGAEDITQPNHDQ